LARLQLAVAGRFASGEGVIAVWGDAVPSSVQLVSIKKHGLTLLLLAISLRERDMLTSWPVLCRVDCTLPLYYFWRVTSCHAGRSSP